MNLHVVEVKEKADRAYRPVIGQELHFERDAAERRAQQYRAGAAEASTRFRVTTYTPKRSTTKSEGRAHVARSKRLRTNPGSR